MKQKTERRDGTDMTRGVMRGREREVSTMRGDDRNSVLPFSRASAATSISFQIFFAAPISASLSNKFKNQTRDICGYCETGRFFKLFLLSSTKDWDGCLRNFWESDLAFHLSYYYQSVPTSILRSFMFL